MNRPLAIVALLYLSGELLGSFLSLRLYLLFTFSLGLAAACCVWTSARSPLGEHEAA